ncbi:zona pellucida sperm-binding protein 3-like [Macrochelys suwanniensis]
MEETLKWLVSTVQEMQQARQADRQALMTWQADQQRTLQEFIREQSVAQQQILQRVPYPWARVDVSQLGAVSLLQLVTVQCEEAQMVITMHRDLSGMGQLLKAADLSLDDWSAERPSNGFQLGEVMHIQADVSTGNHVALSLFVDSCVATLSPYRDSSPRYAVIVFNGCLLEGRSDDTISAFISPWPRQDTLKFMVDEFRFAGNTSNFIYITCHLKVTSADQAPDPLNKAWSFTKVSNVWSTVEGTRNICSCCEAGNCGQPGQSRRVNTLDSWPGRCFQREMPSGNDQSSWGPSEGQVAALKMSLQGLEAIN